MRTILEVNNVKCGGCATQIIDKLRKIEGVRDVIVDVTSGQIEVAYDELRILRSVKSHLNRMGYTEYTPGIFDTAKSYVSCMIGRTK